MRVASNFSDKIDFAISDKKYYKYELRNCGYDYARLDSPEPLICIYKDEDRFNMNMKFSDEAFSDFVAKFLAGNAKR